VRLLGLLLVLIYHLFESALPAGFLGVDVFFVLSGYLTTALIIEEYRRDRTFRIFRFYTRRVKRLLPPLFLAVAFTLPLATLIDPDFTSGILRQLAAAFGFVTNYFETATGGSYVESFLPHLYIHTWSLAVEAHYYLVWAFILLITCGFVKFVMRGSKARGLDVSVLRVAVFFLAVFAGMYSYYHMNMTYSEGADTSAVYFDSVSHSLPLFAGSAAAALWGARTDPSVSRFLRRKYSERFAVALLTVCCSVIVILALALKFTDSRVYRYGFLTVSLCTVGAIFAAHALHVLTPAGKEPWTLTAVTDMSYDIYLVHWPLYIILSSIILSNLKASLATLGASIAMSAVMYYVMEPLLKRGLPLHQHQYQKAISKKAKIAIQRAVSTLVAAVLIFCIYTSYGVVRNAPIITSIERDIAIGYVMQDANGVETLERQIAAINKEPVSSSIEIKAVGDIEENLYVPPPATPTPTGPPTVRPPDISNLSVTIIGDSVILGAKSAIDKTISGVYMDAEVSRSVSTGYQVFKDLQDSGSLCEYVIIALGTNPDNNYISHITNFINDLEEGHRLILVTPYDGRSGDSGVAGKTAIWERGLDEVYPFVTIADWNAIATENPSMLAGDRVHMGGNTSRQTYANMLSAALDEAASKPAK